MRSSTSSFDTFPDHAPRALLIAALLALAGFAGMEALWRAQGVRPNIPNSDERWRRELDRALADPAPGVAMLGSSRFQTGVDPTLLGQRLGAPVYNLSFNNTNPLPILSFLADHTTFSGDVLIEAMPTRLFGEDADSIRAAQKLIDGYTGLQNASDDLNDRLGEPVYGHLAALHPSLRLREILGSLASFRRPPLANKAMRPDRLLEIDFSLVPASELEQVEARVKGEIAAQRPLSAQALEERVQATTRAVAKLRARGARVIFVRPLAVGGWRTLEDQRYPAEQFSARLIAPVATCALDFTDSPAMLAIAAPDLGHIDRRDVPAMTEAIAALITSRCPPRQTAP